MWGRGSYLSAWRALGHRHGVCVAAFVLALLAALPVSAETRVALVIGNNRYSHTRSLENAVADAGAFRHELEVRGFRVIHGENSNRREMEEKIGEFLDAMSDSAVGIIYYSGHGVQVDNENYLIPTDMDAKKEADIAYDGISLGHLIDLASRRQPTFLLAIIDACRDNPFDFHRRDMGGGGLVPTSARGVMTIFSAGAGQKAIDRLGPNDHDPNGLFTRELLKAMRIPGLSSNEVLKLVKDSVHAKAKAFDIDQTPALYDESIGTFVFTPAVSGPSSTNYSIDDLAKQQATQVVASRLQWEGWQKSMQAAFDMAAAFQGSVELRHAAWDRFLNVYHDKNPYSNEDDRLRAEAARRNLAIVDAPVALVAPPPDTVASQPSAESAQPVGAGGLFRDCADVCPAMVKIPAGEFDMGSPESEPDRYADEGPVHRVTIGYAFAVSADPITVGEFAHFVEDAHYDAGNSCLTIEAGELKDRKGRNWRSVGFDQTDASPVVCVSWDDAVNYAAWLSRKTGRTYRLLSEAEYEYVNRAATSTAYWWGDDPAPACVHANGADLDLKPHGPANWPYNSCHDGFAFTSPVGSFKSNGFGLYDTTGNAWSWTEDCYHDSYAGAPTDGSANAGGDCGLRVLRGGSWAYIPGDLRSARRGRKSTEGRDTNVGFRVARTL